MSRSTLASASSAISGLLRNDEQHLLLALQLLQQVRLEVGAARHLEDLEQREQRDVVVQRDRCAR
jgi:hypothetical protein